MTDTIDGVAFSTSKEENNKKNKRRKLHVINIRKLSITATNVTRRRLYKHQIRKVQISLY
jgi:hypothetical protein